MPYKMSPKQAGKLAVARAKAARSKKERIQCPDCKKVVARADDWAPGYPTLYKHNGLDGKVCEVGYLRESKDGTGRWVSG